MTNCLPKNDIRRLRRCQTDLRRLSIEHNTGKLGIDVSDSELAEEMRD